MVLKENYVNGETLTAAAFNEVTDQVNTNTDQLIDLAVTTSTGLTSIRANRNLTGGGTITVDASGNVLWSQRFLVISNGRGANFATAGFFDINCPVTGTITGVGGATNKTATAAGIPLAVFEALYYILPIGSGSGSVAANFRVVSYTTGDLEIPYNWVLICLRNGDNGTFTFNNGITLSASQSMNSIQQTNANTANTLVRRDASGNFSAGTVTASTLVSNVAQGTAPLTVTSTTRVNNLNAQYVTAYAAAETATASSLAARDAQGNLVSRGFISGFTTTVTSATPVTLTSNAVVATSNQIQEFTGGTAQTVTLPSAGVVAGQQYKIMNNSTAVVTVQSSLPATITSVIAGTEVTYTALVATPTAATHWEESYYAGPTTIMTLSNKTLTTPVINGVSTGTGVATAGTASTLAMRDANANLTARGFIPGFTTTVASATAITMTIASNPVLEITGSLAQTVVLPTTTSVVAGQRYTVINNSTPGAVTVQSSTLATIGAALTTGTSADFIALVTNPTTAANWHRK